MGVGRTRLGLAFETVGVDLAKKTETSAPLLGSHDVSNPRPLSCDWIDLKVNEEDSLSQVGLDKLFDKRFYYLTIIHKSFHLSLKDQPLGEKDLSYQLLKSLCLLLISQQHFKLFSVDCGESL